MNAHTKRHHLHPHAKSLLDDNSLIVTEEQLRRFGNGDAKYGRHELRALLAKEPEGGDERPVIECPKSVRIAGPRDEQACVDLWMMDLQQNAAHVAEIDRDKVEQNVQAGTRRRGAIVGVIDGPEYPVGLCVLHPMQWHWSQAWFFQEMCSFVHPDHRKSSHADDLLQFQKWFSHAQSKGFGYRVYVLNGVLGAWRVHGKIALYRRRFRQVGAAFLYPAPQMKGN